MDRIIITTFDYKKQNNILAAKALYIAEEIAFRSSKYLWTKGFKQTETVVQHASKQSDLT